MHVSRASVRRALILRELERMRALLLGSSHPYDDLVWDTLDRENEEPDFDPEWDMMDNPLPWEGSSYDH